MSPERWRQAETIYNAAMETDPAHRRVFLAQASGGDEELRREVESLLAQDASGAGRLDRPAWDGLEILSETMPDPRLTPGALLGPYRIEAMLGAGGMGQVYGARDTRLDRTVAIKVLDEKFSNRFQREARAISSLNHPNICTLYDVGPNYLVMELLEGETLAVRLRSGPLPLDLAIRYGVQVAGALATAHAQGIIHRDLKPGNIMVTKSAAKVLDFGLARFAAEPELGSSQAIVGTPAYMAPEQSNGLPCDARTDLFALGLVLYEMAVGQRPAAGVAPAIDWLPERFAHVVARCLAADPLERWQSARDVKAELEWAGQSRVLEPPGNRNSLRKSWAAGALAFAALAAAGGTFLGRNAPQTPGLAYVTSIPAPPNADLPLRSSGRFALAPDGRRIAVAAGGRLWLRELDQDSAQPLEGTDGGAAPFWSPDSRHLAFFTGTNLKTISLAGGPATTIAEAKSLYGGSWNRDGELLFASGNSPLRLVPALGGTPIPITNLDGASGERTHAHPSFLPDGRHFVYVALGTKAGGAFDPRGLYAGSLSSGQPKLILAGASNAHYAQGHLLFVRQGSLMVQRFDIDRLALTGEAAVLAKEVQTGTVQRHSDGAFSISPAGVLAYQAGSSEPSTQLVWVDRGGKRLGALGGEARYSDIALSPDGGHAAVTVLDRVNGACDIWVFDLVRGLRTRLTSGARDIRGLAWSPDGSEIAFRRVRDGRFDLYRQAANGLGEQEFLLKDNLSKYPSSWSPDGRFLLYFSGLSTPETGSDVLVLPLFGERTPHPLVQSAFEEMEGRFSPDGRWFSYSSNESGEREVYVQPFPGPGERRRVSTTGAYGARWRSNGREIYYVSRGRMMAAAVDGRGTSFEVGVEKPLFEIDRRFRNWDVTADGQRFLFRMVPHEPESSTITLVLNWTALLSKRP
jgi:Tol biopolymer transport system component/predicted Ser/Thr protein kinase